MTTDHRPRRLPAGIPFLLLAWTTVPVLPAQFVNRATWLGGEEESVRRNFGQGTEYYLDRMSYTVRPPWWDRGLERFGNEIDIRLGSVTTDEFTIESHFDHAIPLGDGVTFRYHMLQSENRDTRFLRNEIALEYETSDTTALFVQGTPLTDKTGIDLSVGAWLCRRDAQALRVMFTSVDRPADKSKLISYEQHPYAVMVAGTFGDPKSHRVAFELGSQLPFEQRTLADGERFGMQRHIGIATAHLRLGGHDWLTLASENEWTDKRVRPAAGAGPTREHFDRSFHQLRAEWCNDTGMPWSVGLAWTSLSESGRRPDVAGQDLHSRRTDLLGVARLWWRIDEKLSFEPQLLAGRVRDVLRDGGSTRNENGFEGKLMWNTRWDFSPHCALTLIVSGQLDELSFGGGGAQFVARF